MSPNLFIAPESESNPREELLPMGRLALEIRGAISAIESYFEANRYELAVSHRARLSRLAEQLLIYEQEPKRLGDSLIAHDWFRIASSELKDSHTRFETAVFRRGFWLK